MYNTVKLIKRVIGVINATYGNHPSKIPEEKVVKTLIYGVKSSGNQIEFRLRQVANLSKAEYPEVNEVIKNDVYVDDCISGETNLETAHERADQLEIVLSKVVFDSNEFHSPVNIHPRSLSYDGEMIHVAGLKWFPKTDTLSINIGELNLSEKRHGKKPVNTSDVIPFKLTQRHSSKVAEITASMKTIAHSAKDGRRSFGKYHQGAVKFTDSQISLHWITNEERPLKQ